MNNKILYFGLFMIILGITNIKAYSLYGDKIINNQQNGLYGKEVNIPENMKICNISYYNNTYNLEGASYNATYQGYYDTYSKYWYNMSTIFSSYNSTYDKWSYNQTYSGSTYNSTYDKWSYNQTQPAITILNTTYGQWWYNMSDGSSGNGTMNYTNIAMMNITNIGDFKVNNIIVDSIQKNATINNLNVLQFQENAYGYDIVDIFI